MISLICAIGLNLFLICHDRARPLTGLRLLLCRGLVIFTAQGICIVAFFTYCGHATKTLEQVNFYEEYLGTREQQRAYQTDEVEEHADVPKRGPGRSSTIVCNHIGFMEILNLVATMNPSFTPKEEVLKIPIVNGIAVAI